MEQHGFIQDMLDVKVLILFVMAKLSYPVSLQKIYELCYQDDKLSYFDVSVAVPQMVQSGHLEQLPDETYRITDKGREATRIFEKQLPYPVREAAQRSALRVVRQIRRDAAIHTSVTEHGEHDLTVRMEMEQVFAIEMAVVSHEQATMLERTFKANAEAIYQKLLGVMTQEYPD